LIILLIVLLQVSGVLRGLTMFVAIIAEILILTTIIKNKKWNFQTWYAFFIFVIILLFLAANTQQGQSEITPALSVEIVVALILGFFITVFSINAERIPKVDVVDVEPETEIIDLPEKKTAKKTVKKKKTNSNKKKNTSKKKL
ncbi:MAG: hypothetical protein KKF89_02915, partial [Nanoarchaeota archaeon]|nr:hypothetical protein [Nanoarchaeota archaeon]